MNAFADACLACFPGDAPAAMPANVQAGEDGMVTADYRCPLCRLEWTARWKVAVAFPDIRIYRSSIPLLDNAIGLLAGLLEGEELEPV